MHEKNREDTNLTYESLVNLEEYHSKFIMEKSILHISKRHRVGQQCATSAVVSPAIDKKL
jgi:hypothetical protein